MSVLKHYRVVRSVLEDAGYEVDITQRVRTTLVWATKEGRTERVSMSCTPRCKEYAAAAVLRQVNALFARAKDDLRRRPANQPAHAQRPKS